MSDIQVKSRWIDKENSDVVVVTGLLDDLILFDYCNNAARKSGSRSVKDFLKKFQLLEDAPVIKPDMVNHPPHYKDASGIECIEVTRHMQFCGGNCFKYLYRAGKKGSTVEDLKKAAWYAKQAGELDERTNGKEWAKALRMVFKHREGNIYKAMVAIRYHWWARVEAKIEVEIARLESE